jgi:glycosyltransferase involved in cell wall biosynthesis
MRRRLQNVTAIHCTTETERQLLAPLRLIAPTVVIPNGLDLGEFGSTCRATSSERFFDLFPHLRDRRIVLFLSRLHPKKGLDLLLPAFATACADDTVLVLAGPCDDEYRRTLAAMVSSLGIDSKVCFTGMLHGGDRIAGLRAAEIFVLPSYQENFGIAVVESLAAGTPVIISDQVNLCHELRDAAIGVIVPNDVGPLAAAIKKLMSDDQMRMQQSVRGMEFVRRYDFERVAISWQSFWNSMTSPMSVDLAFSNV